MEEEKEERKESSKIITIKNDSPDEEEVSLDKKLEMMEQKMGEESKNRRLVRQKTF